MKKLIVLAVFALACVSSSPAQGFFLKYNHGLRREIRAGASFAAGNITVWPYNSAVRVQVLVDTVGVWPADSIVVAFNNDTTSTNTVKLRASQISGVPWDGYGPRTLAPVHSVQIWGTQRFPVTLLID